MRFLPLVVAALLAPPLPAQPTPRPDDQAVISRLEAAIPRLMEQGDVPGLQIALARANGLVWHRGFGVKDAKERAPVDASTVFEAASLSKPVFAYAVLKLVDAGKLDLETPLQHYLPGGYDVGDDPRLGRITARHVLSHTTGFPNWRQGDLKIHFSPGERFSYSGEGYVYLAKVVERITGETFNDFMTRTVFVPLGMTSSSYVWRDDYEKLKTSRHDVWGNPAEQVRRKEANAAASLHTTAADFGRFVAAALAGTGLRPATRREMLTPQIQVGESGTNTTSGAPAKLSAALAWGLGWGLQTAGDGLSFWHWGDNGNSKAYVVVHDGRKLGVVFFANSTTGLSIAREIVAAAVGGEQPAIAWIRYDSYDSPARVLLKAVAARGAAAALAEYRDRRETGQRLDERQMNRLGYDLLYGAKRPADAIEVFKLNVADYPQSANVHDSLGEAYMVAGQRERAIESYQRASELDPGNAGILAQLKKLREKK